MSDKKGCEICGTDTSPPKQKHGVWLCYGCRVEVRRGLLPKILLDRFKAGTWIPSKKKHRNYDASKSLEENRRLDAEWYSTG